MSAARLLALAAVLWGCGGEAGGTSFITGAVDGRTSFPVGSTLVGPLLGADTGAVVLLTDAPDACAALAAGRRPRGSYLLFFKLYHFRAGSGDLQVTPTGPGSYAVGTITGGYGKFAEAYLLPLAPDCKAGAPALGTMGSVVVEQGLAAPGPASGRFEATFAGGRLEGTFAASACDARPDPGVFSAEREIDCGP